MSGIPLRAQGRNSSGPRLNRLVNPERQVSRGHAVAATPGHQTPPRGWKTFNRSFGQLSPGEDEHTPSATPTTSRQGRRRLLPQQTGPPAALPRSAVHTTLVRLHLVGTTRCTPPDTPPAHLARATNRTGGPEGRRRSFTIESGVRSRCVFAAQRPDQRSRPARAGLGRPARPSSFLPGKEPLGSSDEAGARAVTHAAISLKTRRLSVSPFFASTNAIRHVTAGPPPPTSAWKTGTTRANAARSDSAPLPSFSSQPPRSGRHGLGAARGPRDGSPGAAPRRPPRDRAPAGRYLAGRRLRRAGDLGVDPLVQRPPVAGAVGPRPAGGV